MDFDKMELAYARSVTLVGKLEGLLEAYGLVAQRHRLPDYLTSEIAAAVADAESARDRISDASREFAVDEALAEAMRHEEEIVRVITESAAEAGVELYGIENHLKSRASLSRKVLTDAMANMGIEDDPASMSSPVNQAFAYRKAAEGVHDVLRFTFKMPFDDFVERFNRIRDAVESRSTYYLKMKNFFEHPKRSGYRGLNATAKNFETGYMFEVQFHTEASYDAKGPGTHDLYEMQRQFKAGSPEYEKYAELQLEVFNKVGKPPGVEGIEDFDSIG